MPRKSKALAAANVSKTKKKSLSQPRRLRGRGDYVEPTPAGVSSALERIESKVDTVLHPPTASLGKSAGRLLGSLVGQGDLGASAGDLLHNWFTGHGDYEITSNSLIPGNAVEVAYPVEFSKSGKRAVRVTEKEYICDVVSSTTSAAFKNQSFRLNPADPNTFPWLSTIAPQFEEYQLNGIIFEFRTTSSVYNGASQALGTVIMATDYNVLDQPYATKAQMENADYAQSTVCSSSALHGVECARNEQPLVTLYCAAYPPSKGDQRLYDLGNFQIASYGVVGTSVTLGELWVSYDISFFKKQVSTGPLALQVPRAQLLADSNGQTAAIPLGLKPTVYGTLPITVVNNVFTFPQNTSAGYFLVEGIFSAATTASVSATPYGTLTNCTAVPYPSLYPASANPGIVNANVAWNFSPYAFTYNSGSGIGYFSFYLKITGPGAVMALAPLAGLTGSTNIAQVNIMQVPDPTVVPLNYLTA